MKILRSTVCLLLFIFMSFVICIGYAVDWIEGIGAILAEIPDDTMNSDGTQLYKYDYYSYNQGYYNYRWYNTAPYGRTLSQCLAGKIPFLP